MSTEEKEPKNKTLNLGTQKEVEERCREFRRTFDALRREIGKVIVGYEQIVDNVLISLFCGGHVLLEGVPGLGNQARHRDRGMHTVRPLHRGLPLQCGGP